MSERIQGRHMIIELRNIHANVNYFILDMGILSVNRSKTDQSRIS